MAGGDGKISMLKNLIAFLSSDRGCAVTELVGLGLIKQYYPRGCSLTSFEHDSDAVRTEALAVILVR